MWSVDKLVRTKLGLLFIGFICVVLSACGEQNQNDQDLQLVSEITLIQLDIIDGSPQQLRIRVRANVTTSGWSEPQLNPYLYLVPPQDGIYDFDFMARPPAGDSPQVITPIEVTHVLDGFSNTFVGVRIHAAQNNLEKLLPQNAVPTAYFEFRGSDALDRFVIRLVEADKIQHARDLLFGMTTESPSVMGAIIKTPALYNPNWSYHLASETIQFFDLAIEVCDANMRYVEDNLDAVGGAFLPNSYWCPWGSEISREISVN